ncbi:hypothetical protein ACFQDE_06840 [Deinococcus caeni]|uniref:hypothetical protein n=1 Tax=Deinococcus caeni TaxID=569127 RepID=UPI0036178439
MNLFRSRGPRRGLLRRLRPPQLLALVYLLGIALGAALLHLPGMTRPGVNLNTVELLFTATSAICITGLVVADTGEAFTRLGQVTIILLAQIGGWASSPSGRCSRCWPGGA